MRGEVGKEIPKKRDGFRRISMTSHMALSKIVFKKRFIIVWVEIQNKS